MRKITIAGREYEIVVGSDVKRDGMFLECTPANDGTNVLIEVFYSDEDGSFAVQMGRETLPFELVKLVIQEAERRLPPGASAGSCFSDVFTDATAEPTLFIPGLGKRGITELHWAAYLGDPDAARDALARGGVVDAIDSYRGYTPLHWLADMAATGGDRLAVLELLVRHGADPNLRSAAGHTALTLAREAGSDAGDELAAALVRLGAR